MFGYAEIEVEVDKKRRLFVGQEDIDPEVSRTQKSAIISMHPHKHERWSKCFSFYHVSLGNFNFLANHTIGFPLSFTLSEHKNIGDIVCPHNDYCSMPVI